MKILLSTHGFWKHCSYTYVLLLGNIFTMRILDFYKINEIIIVYIYIYKHYKPFNYFFIHFNSSALSSLNFSKFILLYIYYICKQY